MNKTGLLILAGFLISAPLYAGKVLAWEDAKGRTWLTYENPMAMAKRHKVKEPAEILKKMTGVPDAVTTEAAGK